MMQTNLLFLLSVAKSHVHPKHKTQEKEHSHDVKTWRYEPTSQGSSKEDKRTNPHRIPSQEAKNDTTRIERRTSGDRDKDRG